METANLPPPPENREGWPWTLGERKSGEIHTDSRLKISVVTPSFNQAAFLEETIRSVLGQEYPNFEYLIFDGASTDGSRELLDKYAGSLAYAVSQPDNGQTDAINQGLQRASGDIVAYLNSDDVYLPGALGRVAGAFSEDETIDILYGERILLIDENGGSLGEDQASQFSLRRLLLADYIAQPATFIRRSVLDTIGPFKEELRYVMDYEFFLRAALAGCRFARLDGPPIAAFRLHTASKTSGKSESGLAEETAMLGTVFDDPRLPRALASLRAKAIANCYVKVAYSQYLAGNLGAARSLLWRGFRICPALLTDSGFLSIAGKTLLGSRLSRRLRELRRDRFRQ